MVRAPGDASGPARRVTRGSGARGVRPKKVRAPHAASRHLRPVMVGFMPWRQEEETTNRGAEFAKIVEKELLATHLAPQRDDAEVKCLMLSAPGAKVFCWRLKSWHDNPAVPRLNHYRSTSTAQTLQENLARRVLKSSGGVMSCRELDVVGALLTFWHIARQTTLLRW